MEHTDTLIQLLEECTDGDQPAFTLAYAIPYNVPLPPTATEHPVMANDPVDYGPGIVRHNRD